VVSPADGDSVLAVGAVTLEGGWATFSSVGPAADGRIKPDVSAAGVGVYCANPRRGTDTEYVFASGTSFACPLAAGVGALVLEAHPELDPAQVSEALRRTASRAGSPDTLLGWGILDAASAVFHHGPVIRDLRLVRRPLENRTSISFRALGPENAAPDSAWVVWHSTGGRHPASVSGTGSERTFEAQIPEPRGLFFIETRDAAGRTWNSPFGAPDRQYRTDILPGGTVDPGSPPFRFTGLYPNPSAGEVTADVSVNREIELRLSVFDVRGRRIRDWTLGRTAAGGCRAVWDGRDASGRPVPAGVYLVRASGGGRVETRKALRVP
jgi:hypothetical protein